METGKTEVLEFNNELPDNGCKTKIIEPINIEKIIDEQSELAKSAAGVTAKEEVFNNIEEVELSDTTPDVKIEPIEVVTFNAGDEDGDLDAVF